jgi:hypothetical protein
MRYELKIPCKNCPFRTDATAIRFTCRDRAEQIEENTYRNGFPCHLTAHDTSDEDEENGGYEATENSQHCVGYLIMAMKDGYDSTPGTNNSTSLFDRLRNRVNFDAPVFDSIEDFLAANESEKDKAV